MGDVMRKTVIGFLVMSVAASVYAATPGGERPRTAERESMDALYSVMATLPVSDRKVLFHGLTPTAKATLWTIHLERFSAEHRLSAQQRGLIAEAAVLFSPTMYSVDRSAPEWEKAVHVPLREFDERVRAAFPRDQAIEAFAQLGPSDVIGVMVTEESSPSHVQALRPGMKPVPLLPSNCSCSTDSDWCWGFSSCGIGGVTCYRSDDGCGTGWNYQCNSRCSYGR